MNLETIGRATGRAAESIALLRQIGPSATPPCSVLDVLALHSGWR
jgi:hypothetical protein